jgi:GNAT superfamily N-acetyltransferase
VSADQIVTIRVAKPGDDAFEAHGRLHEELYSLEYGFGEDFVRHVYKGLRDLDTALVDDPEAGRLWVVEEAGELRGGIGVTRQSASRAQLRWFLLHPALRGHGMGRELVQRVLEWARERDYGSIFLTTVPELTTAAHLYREAGFAKIRERPTRPWGDHGIMQLYALGLTQPNVNA